MTRMSFVAARYDEASQSVANLTFISCSPSYFKTTGNMVEQTDNGLSSRLLGFDEDHDLREEISRRTYPMRLFLEKEIHQIMTLDTTSKIEGNEFAKHVYRMSQQKSPLEPLKPEELVASVQKLYTTVYAVFAITYLFETLHPPMNTTGLHTVEEKRLFVVPVVAYIILSVLTATLLLNACLFWYAKQKSMLKEEPFGLLSYAGIMYKSEINTVMMDKIVEADRDPGRARESAQSMYDLDNVRWVYDESLGRVTFRGTLPMQNLGAYSGNATPSEADTHQATTRRSWALYSEQIMQYLKHCGKLSIDKCGTIVRYCAQNAGSGGRILRGWSTAKIGLLIDMIGRSR